MNTKNDFLKNAKVGDRFCYNRHLSDLPGIITVKKITPTGQIVDTKGNRWKNGKLVGSGSYRQVCLYPVTPAIRSKIRRFHMLRFIENFKFNKLTTTEIESIFLTLRSTKPHLEDIMSSSL